MTEVGELVRCLERAVDRCCPAHLRASRDDIVQAAALKATEAIAQGREINRAWLKRVAYTTMIDELRDRRRFREEEDAASADPSPEQKARLVRVRDALDHCMEHLAERRRHAVLLFLQGHTAREIGRLVGVSQRSAENLVFRGRDELRGCLRRAGATLEAL